MEENYRVVVHWSARRESVSDCAKRAEDTLNCLSEIDERFSNWYLPAKSRTQSLRNPISRELTEIRGRFQFNGVDELGYRLVLWNGSDVQSVGLQMGCGCYSEILPVNSCIVNLPKGDLLNSAILVKVLICLVSAWQPSWGVVTTNLYRDLVTQRDDKNHPYIGWITYLPKKIDVSPILTRLAKVIDLGNLGTVITVTDELFTAANQAHVQTAANVQQTLKMSGVM